MSARARMIAFALVSALFASLLAEASAADGDASAPAPQYALLVGCTEYPYLADRGLRPLNGPANDIPLWRKTLTAPSPAGFGFPIGNVQVLLGWPKEESQRPSRANIVRAFEALVTKSKPGVRIMIVLSGHGTQQPIPEGQDPFDPKNPEPDGLDEVFLPADSREGSPAIENGIVDNEIGGWLDRMRSAGADVWIVFDCCHSGTMTRDLDDVERSRNVEPSALGIKPETLVAAARKAEAAAKRRADEGIAAVEPAPKIAASRAAGTPGSDGAPGRRGSLVAFYAAQPFERAPELPLPEGKPQTPENYYGLLSYTLIQTLNARRAALSYRELSRLLAASYRARRGTRFPTPFAEGDLDREVLGARQWPLRPEYAIARRDGALEVNAGEVHGLTVDSVLTLLPPHGDPRDPETVLGHVRVAAVTTATATVVACEFNGIRPPADIPDLCRARIARRDFGEMRVKLFVPPDPRLRAALARLPTEVAEQIVEAKTEAEAQWLLRLVPPEKANEFGLPAATVDRAALSPGEGRSVKGAPPPGFRKLYSSYDVADPEVLGRELERDLPKVFRWQNLWRVGGGVNALDGGETHGLKFDAVRLTSKDDAAGEPLRGTLRNGDLVRFTLQNDSVEDLWVTLLYLNSNLGVKQHFSGQIPAGRGLKPFVFRMKADAASAGAEGMIVFVAPPRDKNPPDYRFLEQEPLRIQDDRTRAVPAAPDTPFGRLLKAAAFGDRTRDMEPVSTTTPAVLAHTWLLRP